MSINCPANEIEWKTAKQKLQCAVFEPEFQLRRGQINSFSKLKHSHLFQITAELFILNTVYRFVILFCNFNLMQLPSKPQKCFLAGASLSLAAFK